MTINIFGLENNLDSDKDGYLDSDELKMGTNPFMILCYLSRILPTKQRFNI